MASDYINPVRFAQQVNEQFINYQLTAFPLSDPDLGEQARAMLRTKLGSPLIKGPYVSLSRSYRLGRNLNDMAKAGQVHRALPGLTEYPGLFAHQDRAFDEVSNGNHCLITTGTGSGKTEAFLYPILNHCLELRDSGAPEGLVAILVYPMNALAYDQLNRLRKMLAGSQISFGMYTGTTPANEGEVGGDVVRMKPGEGKADIPKYAQKYKAHLNVVISPSEERLTEQQMTAHPPRILLTNVNQLEYLITRGKDLGMFINAPLKFIVFDEAHTYSGASGAEVACLIRRIKAFCGKDADEVICIGTSATITDPELGEEAGRRFAQRFFGVNPEKIALVKEEFEKEQFPSSRYVPPQPGVDTVALLDDILKSLDDGDSAGIARTYGQLTGKQIQQSDNWSELLYDQLKSNDYIYQLFHQMEKANALDEAVQRICTALGRGTLIPSSALRSELLCYLVLAAAAEKNGNPLLRPKLHYFLRGLEGAVISFGGKDGADPQRVMLSMSLTQAIEKYGVDAKACPPVLVCRTCGQHYFEGYYRNFRIDRKKPAGGDAEGDNVIWEPVEKELGYRVVFTNHLVGIDDEGDIEDFEKNELFFCRWCGTLHQHEGSCSYPKCKRKGALVPVYFIPLNDSQGLGSCESCGQRGRGFAGRFIEPIKPLRAITVADVHILAQNMINAVRGARQKLIVFTDNRQDAAFQAGWMQDHARRYRLRHLIYEYLRQQIEPSSISDIVEHLFKLLKLDHNLAQVLAPEVFVGRAKESYGRTADNELKYFLRIALMLEFGSNFKKIDCLETWGLVKIIYKDVSADHAWITEWSKKLKMEPAELADAVSALLDVYRRTRMFYDEKAPIFSRYWHEGDEEIQRGYLHLITGPGGKPLGPKGIKEHIDPADSKSWLAEFASSSGKTTTQQFVGKWGIPQEIRPQFLTSLWDFVTNKTGVLSPVELKGNKGGQLPGTAGAYQVSAQQMAVVLKSGRFRCATCKRIHARQTPNGACSAYNCTGTVRPEQLPEDNYDLQILNLPFSMVAAHEHSAQVPGKAREKLEEEFKKTDGRYNCLICTPTLELGVDIGDLDMILMRNVPPTASNYWQRAGRAGRRYRMAVVYTYSRRSQHDNYFFEDPLLMLAGAIQAPRFNLRNEVMLRKHVHSAVLSAIIRLTRISPEESGLSSSEIATLRELVATVFPEFIVSYLFDEHRNYRIAVPEVSVLQRAIDQHEESLRSSIKSIFAKWWPTEDTDVVTEGSMTALLKQMPDRLQETLVQLHRRMMWAKEMQERLTAKQNRGLLEVDEERVLDRCRRFLKKLAQNTMETYSLNVLAREGFLPGYEVLEGTVKAFASRAFSELEGRPDFELSRPPSIAIREFVPGNAIYANSGKYRLAYYHLPIGENRTEPTPYLIDVANGVIVDLSEKASQKLQYSDSQLLRIRGFLICDAEITHMGRISDEEQNRFQLPVTVLGYLKDRHRGGSLYSLKDKHVQLRFGQELRLLNIGPADKVKDSELGFPICTVCGGTRSPYMSQAEQEHFESVHKDKCGKPPERTAIAADTVVDGLLFDNVENSANAVNLAEAIIIGSTQVVEISRDDLNFIVIPMQTGGVILFVYDPMSGGSGLLQQIINSWQKVCEHAIKVLNGCVCEQSCYKCMKTYRNLFHHITLNRRTAADLMEAWNSLPKYEMTISPIAGPSAPRTAQATNVKELSLEKLLQENGFPTFVAQHSLALNPPPFQSTTPDLYYEDMISDIRVAVYLDGLSKNVHGNVERQRADVIIRSQLEAMGIDVVEIATSDLADPAARILQLQRIASKIRRADLRDRVKRGD